MVADSDAADPVEVQLLDALSVGLEHAAASFKALQLPAAAMMRIVVRISELVRVT